jgi:pyruvate formate lyase activating enzyme
VSDSPGPLGMIFDIQRFCIHDGPGIRTTVFMKGCPMRCLWCHNPESQSIKQEVLFYASRCVGCGRCLTACPNGAIILSPPSEGADAVGERILRDRCKVCGACVDTCYAEALVLSGRLQTPEEVLAVVERDRPFYETSGGGMTVSGGEPLAQPVFLAELLRQACEAGLHVCVDTCGLAPWDNIASLLPLVNLFLFDLKSVSPELHRHLTGVDNALVLENARRLAGQAQEILFRVPVIPGMNDSEEELASIGGFLASLNGHARAEVMPYHRLGASKYQALDRPYPPEDLQPSDDSVARAQTVMRSYGVDLAG